MKSVEQKRSSPSSLQAHCFGRRAGREKVFGRMVRRGKRWMFVSASKIWAKEMLLSPPSSLLAEGEGKDLSHSLLCFASLGTLLLSNLPPVFFLQNSIPFLSKYVLTFSFRHEIHPLFLKGSLTSLEERSAWKKQSNQDRPPLVWTHPLLYSRECELWAASGWRNDPKALPACTRSWLMCLKLNKCSSILLNRRGFLAF